MGIPSFWSRMSAAGHAEVAAQIGQYGDEQKAHAIIDAPGLAFEVLRSSKERLPAVTDFGICSVPAYAAYADEAIHFLETLERFGFIIDAIFFDGALPASKRETRIERATDSARALDVYRRRQEKVLANKATVSERGEASRASRELVPPFLVQAVQDALLSSRFASVTLCVPGEADEYCAAAARKAHLVDPGERVAIFTNDSDLAVFNTFLETRIVIMNSVECDGQEAGSILRATQYWPHNIARKLGCTGLIPLAWYMKQHPRDSVPKLAALLNGRESLDGADYLDFAEQYSVLVQPTLTRLRSPNNQSERELLLGLDARVAELVHQAKNKAGTINALQLDVFLPSLVEDSSRASAWHIGAGLRDCAYTILLTVCKFDFAVLVEHKRAGKGVGMRMAARLMFSELTRSLVDLCDLLIAAIRDAKAKGRSRRERWRFAVLQVMLKGFLIEGMTFPLPGELLAIVTGQSIEQWHTVHLSAHYQATFYSLRMLFQIMRYVKRTHGAARPEYMHGSRNIFDLLLTMLDNMPGIPKFLEPDLDKDKTWIPEIEGWLLYLDESWKLPPDDTKRKRKSERRARLRNKETGAKKVKAESMPSVDEAEEDRLANNPFAALPEE